MRHVRALPTLFRIGIVENFAYRAEFVVWMLTTTMPLIMLGLWTTVADEGPFASFSSADFVAYYLATLIVRNLTGSWVAWQIGEDIQYGTLSMRLLRPVHPLVAYAASHGAAIPMRGLIALPVALVLLFSSGSASLPSDPAQLALVVPSLVLAWIISFCCLFALGCLAFWVTKLMSAGTVYFLLFNLLSGYLLPLALLPGWIAKVAAWTPFPSMLSTPVRLLTHALPHDEIARLLAVQGGWAAGAIAAALVMWRLGVRHFEAVGG